MEDAENLDDFFEEEKLWQECNPNPSKKLKLKKKRKPITIKCGSLVIICEDPDQCTIFKEEPKNQPIEVELLYDENAVKCAVHFVNTGFLELDGVDVKELCRVAFLMGIATLEEALAPVLADIVRSMDHDELKAFMEVERYNKDELCQEVIYLYTK